MPQTLFILNGPNLNLLGVREPEIYGTDTLADIEAACRAELEGSDLALRFHQTNAEHEMIDWIQEARTGAAGLILNPAAFSYASYPILDALKMCDCPIIEVHISNIHRREEAWRKDSLLTKTTTGIISGLGTHGYALAVRHILKLRAA